MCNAEADRRFRAYASAQGWDPDEPFVGGYVDWEWRHARHAYDGLVTSVRGKKVLEFGCHFGGTSVVLASLGARVEAVDVERRYVELTRLNAERHGVGARVRARLVPDTTRLPFAGGEFDLVSCNSVLEYVPAGALDGVLRELDRVLAPGGYVVILGTSNRLWPYEPHTHRWLTNYVPPALYRLLSAGPPRVGVSPWRLRGGFGDRYLDLTSCEGGRLLVDLKAKMGASPGRLRALGAANRLLLPLGAHAGLVTPTITMVLQKRADAGPSAADARAA
ncbi:MAG TPA: class I SAM-dependent methyltransferase [Polyangiaceae bacterium]|nr:class I SAM-dependent methyltransferase [Polyangiaceae bacterium]